MLRTAFAGALLLAPVPVLAQPEQFNLHCTGTTTSTSNAGEKLEPYETVFRIDLAAKKWCEDECRALHDIHEVQPTQITLTDDKVDTPSEQSFLSNFINRTTGKHYVFSGARYRSLGIVVSIESEGECKVEPFDGFPDFDTLF